MKREEGNADYGEEGRKREEGNADHGEMVYPSQQHVAPCVKGGLVGRGLCMMGGLISPPPPHYAERHQSPGQPM